MTEPATRRTGRPRDASIDARALDAARQLLVEEGFSATTIQAIADRSGVHASAIYRRWASRLELIEDAAFAGLPSKRVRPTGDLRDDLGQFLHAYVTTFDSAAVRAAMPGLLASDQSARRTPEAWLRLTVRPQFRELLAAAPPGAVDPGVDADDVFDLLLGAVLVRALVPEEIRRRPPIERTVDLLLRALSPDVGGRSTDSS
jgi:AcrR family transcriptional regulator